LFTDDHQVVSGTEIQEMVFNTSIELNADHLQQEIFTALEEETHTPLTECISCSVHTF